MGKKETNVTNSCMIRLGSKGVVVWKNARGVLEDRHGNKIKYGVGPNGASDLIGFESLIITADMVGQRFARFVAPEIKTLDGVVGELQKDFQALVIKAGGKAPVLRSEADVDSNF